MYKNILNQSPQYRKKVAIGITAIIAIVIFSAWLSIASFNIRQTLVAIEQGDDEIKKFADFPALRQDDRVLTELEKQQQLTATAAGGVLNAEEEITPEENAQDINILASDEELAAEEGEYDEELESGAGADEAQGKSLDELLAEIEEEGEHDEPTDEEEDSGDSEGGSSFWEMLIGY